jgi:hypothetical protein
MSPKCVCIPSIIMDSMCHSVKGMCPWGQHSSHEVTCRHTNYV